MSSEINVCCAMPPCGRGAPSLVDALFGALSASSRVSEGASVSTNGPFDSSGVALADPAVFSGFVRALMRSNADCVVVAAVPVADKSLSETAASVDRDFESCSEEESACCG